MKHLTAKEFRVIKSHLSMRDHGELLQTVDHVKVHSWLGIKTPVNQWISRAIKKFGFVEGMDFVVDETVEKIKQQKCFHENINNLQKRTVTYHCSRDMVKQLAMASSGEKGQLVRKYFLDCETIAHEKLIQQSQRETLRIEYRPMTDAILDDHENPKPFHFTNENNMIYRIMFGATAAEIKRDQGLQNTETLRDHLTVLEQKCLIEMQRVNTALITLGHDFQQRKQQLDVLYNKRFKAGLIEESHLLNA